MANPDFYNAFTYRPHSDICCLVKRAHSIMVSNLEPVFRQHGLTFIQYLILAQLVDAATVSPRELCSHYRHNSGAMTRVIDQLVERGLLLRVRRDRDRRKVHLQLTTGGREAAWNLIPLVVERLNAAMADFTKSETKELERLLVKYNTGLQAAATI